MHGTHTRFVPRYLSSSLVSAVLAFSITFFLAAVTGINVAEIDISFLNSSFSSKNTYWQNGSSFCNRNI